MDANEFTFGVEIECLIPVAVTVQVGGYHAGRQIEGLPVGWNAQADGSIRTRRGYRAVEVVSPILKGADGMQQLKLVCDWLNSIGAKVNASTGLHVHVGFAQDVNQQKRLVTVVANFEKAIFAATGTKSRERGHYCRSVQQSQIHRDGHAERADRYHVLNVATRRPTVEIRAFAGTTNYTKIASYVCLCIGLVEKTATLKRLPKWEAKATAESSPIFRGGVGTTALNRLFYWLGWTKGRETRTFGLVGAGNGAPTLRQLKNQLIRLAKKYDAAS